MMLISEKCQSAVCFLSSDGALEGEGTTAGSSLSHPTINWKVHITSLSLWPGTLSSVLCAHKGWPVRWRTYTRALNCGKQGFQIGTHSAICLKQKEVEAHLVQRFLGVKAILLLSVGWIVMDCSPPPSPPTPAGLKQPRSYEIGLLIQIHANGRHGGITSTKYAKVHTGLIPKGSRYAATLLEDE